MLVGQVVAGQLGGGEEQGYLELCGGGRIGAVGKIIALRAAEIASDGAGVGLVSEGSAEHPAGRCDNLIGLEYHYHHRGGGDKVGQLIEEGLVLVDSVEPAGELLADVHEFCRDDFSALSLKARNDFADEVPMDGVRLNDD